MATWVYKRSHERRASDRALQRRLEMAAELGRAEHLVELLATETTDEFVRGLAREWLIRAEARRVRIQRVLRGERDEHDEHNERGGCGVIGVGWS